MYQEKGVIANLVHLYVDGAFSRRELVQRVARHTGSIAAAMTALGGFEVMHAQAPPACPDGIRVPADAPDIVARDVQFSGDGGTLLGYLAYPKTNEARLFPGVMVVHENQGLLEHHKDVTRRVARAGFVGVSVDLLSRQGGTNQFPDAVTRSAAYGRTNQFQRRSDLISTLSYAKGLPNIVFNRIGIVGFCAILWNAAAFERSNRCH
jgi:carboxymethylenebutenolidase